MHKNVRDMQAALQKWGFVVNTSIDEPPSALFQSIQGFTRRANATPPDAIIFFYFTGHGLQVDAENLMLGAGMNPTSPADVLLQGSVHLRRDVLEQLPRRPQGLSIAVMDTCRTSLRDAMQYSGGLNQVEAPPGCLIAFSTAAGRPAIAPAVDTMNTFYTGSLVKVLGRATGQTSFSDLFRLVKLDVQQAMLTHPVQVIRQYAQFPFIAENTLGSFRLSAEPDTPAPVANAESEAKLWEQLQKSSWPADVQRMANEFLGMFPSSSLRGSAEVAREGARQAVEALASRDVRLYRSAFHPATDDATLIAEIRKAARGDKDAAARLARMYQRGERALPIDQNRYEGWMQFAAALGNGIACYELALHYRKSRLPALAGQFEAQSRELGFTPPPSLDNTRK